MTIRRSSSPCNILWIACLVSLVRICELSVAGNSACNSVGRTTFFIALILRSCVGLDVVIIVLCRWAEVGCAFYLEWTGNGRCKLSALSSRCSVDLHIITRLNKSMFYSSLLIFHRFYGSVQFHLILIPRSTALHMS